MVLVINNIYIKRVLAYLGKIVLQNRCYCPEKRVQNIIICNYNTKLQIISFINLIECT